MSERLTVGEQLKWGFPQPTIIIDAQSAPALRGIEAEQMYYRMFLMGKHKDKAIVNYPIDPNYITYLGNTLAVPMPEVIKINNNCSGFLTGDILSQPEIMNYIGQLTKQKGYKIQFFNLTPDEVTLAKKLDNPTYIQDINAGERLGTKNGFREFCHVYGIPMPSGAVCLGLDQVLQVSDELKGHDIIIKSYAGTGGAELGSNVQITIAEVAGSTNLPELLALKMQSLMPKEPPYVVEQYLNLPEASLHIFLDDKGNVVMEPTVFGQFAHEGSYVGGHFPNGFTDEFNRKIKVLASNTIIPALKNIKATGMHCMDFLYDDVTNEFYFIEDNTRPGALDFISHLVSKVAETHRLTKPAWYHYNLPLAEVTGKNGITFAEIIQALDNIVTPGESFVLISNPNVLPYGYALHLTGVSTGEESSPEKAKQIFSVAAEKLKKHYGYNNKIPIP